MTLSTLCATALVIGAGHTLLGPDHYVPFVAMARAGCWSRRRTAVATAACAAGHVAGSVVIGFAAIPAGMALDRVEWLEAWRGDLAAWLLVAFGLAYTVWGCVRPPPRQGDGGRRFQKAGSFALDKARSGTPPSKSTTCDQTRSIWAPWTLFLVFLFGPCEPLIPLLMYPAAQLGPGAVAAVAVAFLAATVGTMLAVVLALRAGCAVVPVPRLHRHGHTLAGLAVTVCGLLVLAGL